MGKSTQVSFRFTPETVEKLKEMAGHENRSMANWIEVMIAREHVRFCFNQQFIETPAPGAEGRSDA